MVIFALGMLGTLAMVVNGLKLSTSSTSRTIASQAATSMAEIVRSNLIAIGSDNAATSRTFAAAAPAIDTDCMKTTACTRNEYVNHAIQAWRNDLATSLPGGTGTVCRDTDPVANEANIRPNAATPWNCDGAGQYVVKVCWNESRISASQAVPGAMGSVGGGIICTWATI